MTSKRETKKLNITPTQTMVAYLGGSTFQTIVGEKLKAVHHISFLMTHVYRYTYIFIYLMYNKLQKDNPVTAYRQLVQQVFMDIFIPKGGCWSASG